MRVYLDNCCYNRPFDEQTQPHVRLETEAKMEMQTLMRAGEVEKICSLSAIAMKGTSRCRD